jgi:HAD superfamily hydrolase (TIGR01509 family)
VITKRFDAILFDADGVVQTTDEKWWFALTELIGPNDPDRVQRFLGDIMAAELPALAGTTTFAGPLGEVLRLWEVTTPASEVLRMWQHIEVDFSMIAAIRELTAQGVRCALATNQHPERAAYMRDTLGYDEVFAELFYSCDEGVAKPDPAFFTRAVERLGVAPQRTLFVDDNQDNVAGAREAGLVAELFARDGGRPELARILAAYETPRVNGRHPPSHT